MLWIFQAQGIGREALASLRMFCQAAAREAATAELARRAGEALDKTRRGAEARHRPSILSLAGSN